MYKFWYRHYSETGLGYSSIGLGIRPAVKFYPIRKEKFGLYGEVKGGVIYMLPEYANAAINYTLVTSLGAEVKVSANNALYGGVGYTHYSNGRRQGAAKNPTWDGAGAQIGIIHTLK